MQHFRKIFFVINPTTPQQTALGRVIDGARSSSAELRLYACVPPPNLSAHDRTALAAAEQARCEAWIGGFAGAAHERGVPVSVEVEISDDWRAAIVDAAQRFGADLIVKATNRHTTFERRLQKTSDWMLLRRARCPILFVKRDTSSVPKNLVAAVDLQNRSPAHQALTAEIVRHAQGIAAVTGATLHAVNAYRDPLHFVDPQDLARTVGTVRQLAHGAEMSPEALLLQVIGALEDPVVVIGSTPHRSLAGRALGNTAERILDRAPVDVLVVIAP